MTSISKCKTLEEFNALVDPIKNPVLGKKGGRKFLANGKEETMNALVHKYLSLVKHSKPDPVEVERAVHILNHLKELDGMKLENLSPKQAKVLKIRQKWGNIGAKFKYGLGFSRQKLEVQVAKIWAVPVAKKLVKEMQKALSQTVEIVNEPHVLKEAKKNEMQKVQKKLQESTDKDLKILKPLTALIKDQSDFKRLFGSVEKQKQKIKPKLEKLGINIEQ